MGLLGRRSSVQESHNLLRSYTSLYSAVQTKSKEIGEILISKGANINAIDIDF